MVQLEIKNLHIKYDDFHAVKGVSLNIPDSDIVTLLGPSGCGKTSILRAVAGFTNPAEGGIYIDGTDITNLSPQKRDMGMIFQNYALWPHMKVEANIGYGLKMRKIPRETRKKKIIEMVKQVQLVGHDQKYPTQLSGGQQQRVALARALAIDPQILLCDEPLSNLDFKLRVELRTEIRDIAKDVGVTVVYVTHDQTEALAISDKVAIIDEGVLVQEGSPLGIFSDPDSLFVANFVGENNSLKGSIKSSDAPVSVKLSSGEILNSNVAKTSHPVGTDVNIVTRFNELNFDPTGGDNIIKGTIRHMAFMGEYLQAEINLSDSTPFTVNINENVEKYASLDKGDEVTIQIPESAMFLFKGTERIR
jgi:ABC-type Fe3+/spermidine/putrescine transport system ATPase subunit